MDILRKAYSLLEKKQQLQMIGLAIIFLFTAIVQLAGIGSIMPFLGLLTNPELVNKNEILTFLYKLFEFNSIISFLFFLGFIVLGLFVFTNFMVAFTLWLTTRFAWTTQARIAITLLSAYLYQPYNMFLNQNTADIGKNILTETHQLVSGILVPILRMGSFGMVAFFTASFLLWYDPMLAFISIVITGGGYGFFYLTVQKTLHQKGQDRFASTTARYMVASEAFGSIKETKVLGKESAFIERFIPPSLEYARAMTGQQMIKDLPRYIFETLAFGSLLGVVLFLIASGRNLQDIVPIAGMYAFAGYRLLPAMNDMYRSLAQIRFNKPVLNTIYEEIHRNSDFQSLEGSFENKDQELSSILSFEKEIELKNITFNYPNANEPAIEKVSLSIKKGSFVGIVGQTGSGKTTLIDIILGLFSPQSGQIKIDGNLLNPKTIRSWQKKIGYVPQDVYLTDETVAANIAFGVSHNKINFKSLEKAARTANIHDFIINELNGGYESVVGERGVRLSGGQRQRIGIARALYHDPDLIILDEATSNLDQSTEASVYKAIQQTAANKTVIMIAHRLHRVRSCDVLYVIKNGKLVGEGTYEDLIKENETFKNMVKA